MPRSRFGHSGHRQWMDPGARSFVGNQAASTRGPHSRCSRASNECLSHKRADTGKRFLLKLRAPTAPHCEVALCFSPHTPYSVNVGLCALQRTSPFTSAGCYSTPHMAKRAHSAASNDNDRRSSERLTDSIEQLSDDINGLMQIVEEGTLLKQLVTEIVTLCSAIDDIRAEIEWASRNLMQARGMEPSVPPVSSMAVDPCDPQWSTKLNVESARSETSDSAEPAFDPLNEHATRPQDEAVGESPVYCCAQPRLTWQDDPETPSVVCQACGYVVAEYGNLVDGRADQQDAFHRPQAQGRLWQDDES